MKKIVFFLVAILVVQANPSFAKHLKAGADGSSQDEACKKVKKQMTSRLNYACAKNETPVNMVFSSCKFKEAWGGGWHCDIEVVFECANKDQQPPKQDIKKQPKKQVSGNSLICEKIFRDHDGPLARDEYMCVSSNEKCYAKGGTNAYDPTNPKECQSICKGHANRGVEWNSSDLDGSNANYHENICLPPDSEFSAGSFSALTAEEACGKGLKEACGKDKTIYVKIPAEKPKSLDQCGITKPVYTTNISRIDSRYSSKKKDMDDAATQAKSRCLSLLQKRCNHNSEDLCSGTVTYGEILCEKKTTLLRKKRWECRTGCSGVCYSPAQIIKDTKQDQLDQLAQLALLEQLDQLDQMDKLDLDGAIERADMFSRAEDFYSAEQQLTLAEGYANDQAAKNKIVYARQRLESQRQTVYQRQLDQERMAREETERQFLAQKKAERQRLAQEEAEGQRQAQALADKKAEQKRLAWEEEKRKAKILVGGLRDAAKNYQNQKKKRHKYRPTNTKSSSKTCSLKINYCRGAGGCTIIHESGASEQVVNQLMRECSANNRLGKGYSCTVLSSKRCW